MDFIATLAELESLYGAPGAAAQRKVAPRLTPEYRRWIERARFCVLSTVGPDGTDGSPRGDDGPVVAVLDDATLALPDWRGNDRIDSLRNIIADPRLSLMFLIPGAEIAVRVNGSGRLTADAAMRARFARQGREPRSLLIVAINEVYFQCARAIVRSALWKGDQSAGLPTAGEILAGASRGEVGGAGYDKALPERMSRTLW